MIQKPGNEIMKTESTTISRRTFVAAAAAAGLLPAGRAFSQTDPKPRSGGRLRVGINSGSARDSLDAKAAVTEADIARQNNLYDTLLYLNPDYVVEPGLAETVESSQSATVWTIKLRRGVVFHNGKALTAKDVAHTIRYLIDPANPGGAASRLGQLDGNAIEIVDDLTLRLRFKTPYSVLRDVFADAGTAAVRVIPEGYDPANPVGTGPFKMQSFEAGVRSLFVKNANYWREEQPYVDELEMINFTDDGARVNALLSNQVDAIAGLPANQMRVIAANRQLKVINSETGAWNPFTMHTKAAPFDDVRVRKAMRLLVNRPQLIQQVFAGQGAVANDLFGRYDPGYAKNLPQRELDIDQAKSLLKQAGREGFAAEVITSPVSAGLVASAEALVQQASLAGVTLTVRQVEPSTFFSQFFLKSPLSQTYWGARNYLLQTADSMLPTAPYNETHWSDERWLKIVTEAFAEEDEAKRNELITAAQTIEYDEGGYINWGFYNKLDATKTSVEGLIPDRSGFSLTSFAFRRAWLSA
jgi:peptide/nickel transport system substrate-binding protein